MTEQTYIGFDGQPRSYFRSGGSGSEPIVVEEHKGGGCRGVLGIITHKDADKDADTKDNEDNREVA